MASNPTQPNYVLLDLAATLEYARNHPNEATQVIEGFLQRNPVALSDERLLQMRENAVRELNQLPTTTATEPAS